MSARVTFTITTYASTREAFLDAMSSEFGDTVRIDVNNLLTTRARRYFQFVYSLACSQRDVAHVARIVDTLKSEDVVVKSYYKA